MNKKKQNPFYELAEHFFGDSSFEQHLIEFEKMFQKKANASYLKISQYEESGHYFVKAELPGIKKDQIRIELHECYLTITITHQEEINIHHTGGSSVSQTCEHISKTVFLPFAPDKNQLYTTYKNSCLLISIPIAESFPPSKN
ncbi:Hsp20/alpha crystallin family protein [Bacillus sp. V2I10]|uniref:Hsp20/alpha crystallin family protein n=1 Tax=Bacillus sp. V2I10 TaxID=3042276 RepID=UPI002783693D|nr:Hsp20/alpha crystallin family protein [Bacillus sp. V2I10]MDQ0858687.1 HSP20 family protein [Bacillus sp. V2I10]